MLRRWTGINIEDRLQCVYTQHSSHTWLRAAQIGMEPQASRRVPILNIDIPFPFEDIYIPLLGLLVFFASMILIGQTVMRFPDRKRSKQS